MRIADIAEFYAERGGGVRTYVNSKFEAAARHGHELIVIAPGPRDTTEHRRGGSIRWIAGPPMPLDPRYHVLYRESAVHAVLDEVRPDVVEGSSPWTGGLFAARWPGSAPRAMVFHQDPVAVFGHTLLDRHVSAPRIDALCRPYWGYLRRLSRRFDATVTSGQWLQRKLERFGIHRSVAVPFGIDRSAFSLRADADVRAKLIARCGAPKDARLLVTVSRHHPEKRLGTVIDAFAQAARRAPLALVIYGDGPLRGWVQRRARAVPGVYVAGFTRFREEIATALASADALLHGSAAETYGLVIAEALCSGLPVIVPNRGGAADLASASCAEVYPPGNVDACAAAIMRLLARDRVALRAAAVAVEVGTMDEHFAQLFALYRGLRRRA